MRAPLSSSDEVLVTYGSRYFTTMTFRKAPPEEEWSQKKPFPANAVQEDLFVETHLRFMDSESWPPAAVKELQEFVRNMTSRRWNDEIRWRTKLLWEAAADTIYNRRGFLERSEQLEEECRECYFFWEWREREERERKILEEERLKEVADEMRSWPLPKILMHGKRKQKGKGERPKSRLPEIAATQATQVVKRKTPFVYKPSPLSDEVVHDLARRRWIRERVWKIGHTLLHMRLI